jgi:hypothetical protein
VQQNLGVVGQKAPGPQRLYTLRFKKSVPFFVQKEGRFQIITI